MRRSQRARKPSISNDIIVSLQEREFYIHVDDDPLTFKEQIPCSHASYWMNVMHDELNFMSHNGVWDITELPIGRKDIGCK